MVTRDLFSGTIDAPVMGGLNLISDNTESTLVNRLSKTCVRRSDLGFFGERATQGSSEARNADIRVRFCGRVRV